MRVTVTGHRNGEIFREVNGKTKRIGRVRCEQLGPKRWKAFRTDRGVVAGWETYSEATNREAAIRLLLTKLGIDQAEYDPTARANR